MTKKEIARALTQAVGGQAFITATQLARAMGRKDTYKVKLEYLDGLEHVGKLYLIEEVADAIKMKARV